MPCPALSVAEPDTTTLEGLDFDIECQSTRCGYMEAHPAVAVGILTCGHDCYGCEEAVARWISHDTAAMIAVGEKFNWHCLVPGCWASRSHARGPDGQVNAMLGIERIKP